MCAPHRKWARKRWVRIDTHLGTYDSGQMATRVKRTYNLSEATVKRVREMSERYGVASSQDAVVELAVDELERRLRDEREGDAWASAAADRAFVTETDALLEAYGTADRETWPPD